jgi:hypothetical protein
MPELLFLDEFFAEEVAADGSNLRASSTSTT